MLSLADVEAAASRIRGRIHRTPVLTSRLIDQACGGATMAMKGEHLQRVGAFKIRGATNAVRVLCEAPGGPPTAVATHSSGNHAAALALASAEAGIACHVVMPEGSVPVKADAARGYGAVVHSCGPTLADREAGLEAVVAETGAAVVHPFDDERVMAGQGTVALELLADVDGLDALYVPTGGGGLLSGCLVVAKALAPSLRVIGVEPSGAADALRSLRSGSRVTSHQPDTIADGLRTTLGAHPWAVIEALVDDIVTVDDARIVEAARLLWTRAKQVVEPSGAVGVAALLDGREAGRRVAVVLSGGNVQIPG